MMLLLVTSVSVCVNTALAMNATVHIPERYTDVVAGERLYFELSIKYPENDIRKDLRIFYSVTDASGNKILQSKVLRAIETQASFMDFVVIPESLTDGLYTLNVDIKDYDNLSANVATTFNVERRLDMLFVLSVSVISILLIVIMTLLVMQIIFTRARWR
jgi:subtilase family serine protease